ncbi:MAG: outer membrane beta-barrel protein [Bacteroidetes bacterium]|nr:outer membrane beta-barrel protein [Bacteroidota bacterium]
MVFISQAPAFAQADSTRLHKLEARLKMLEMQTAANSHKINIYEKQTFYLYQSLPEGDSTESKFKIGGFGEAYFALYSDSTGTEFQKFPTSAPRNRQFGLNMLYLSAQYSSNKARGNLGLQFGDIPLSSWDPRLNMIQEANIGLRFHPKIWLDAGFFRTHIGMESIQPRENVTTSIAVTTYFEPYFLSGAKLSFLASEKLTLQVQAFNGFNNFIENNRNKAFGASAIYVFGPKAAVTLNSIFSNEATDGMVAKNRLYNDIYYVYRGEKVDFGAEFNFGMQTNSGLADSTAMAFIYSGILLAKYKFEHFGIYARGEFFEDSDEILTGPVENSNHQLVGINLVAGTLGIEFKPLPNAYLRLESRYLQTTELEDIFYWKGEFHHYRRPAGVGLRTSSFFD